MPEIRPEYMVPLKGKPSTMRHYRIIVPCESCIVYEVEAEDESAAKAMVEAGEVETANEEEPILDMNPDSWEVDDQGEVENPDDGTTHDHEEESHAGPR